MHSVRSRQWQRSTDLNSARASPSAVSAMPRAGCRAELEALALPLQGSEANGFGRRGVMPPVSVGAPQGAKKEFHEPAFFGRWLTEIDAGSRQALGDLVATYSAWVEIAVEQTLNEKRLRSKVERDDIVQSVWLHFFEIPAKAQAFTSPDHLAAYLRGMAIHQVQKHHEHYHRQRRSISREATLDPSSLEQQPSLSTRADDPADLAIARETWDLLLADRSPRDQEVLRLKAEEFSEQEIASHSGINERTVRKILERVKADWKRLEQ